MRGCASTAIGLSKECDNAVVVRFSVDVLMQKMDYEVRSDNMKVCMA